MTDYGTHRLDENKEVAPPPVERHARPGGLHRPTQLSGPAPRDQRAKE